MPLPYVTLAMAKEALGIDDTNDDALLARYCDQTNYLVESITGRAIGSSSVTQELLDGDEAMDNGASILYPRGIRTITTLEVAPYTGASFQTIPSTDYFVDPPDHLRSVSWPGFEIRMTDIPSTSNPYPLFMPGKRNVRLTAAIGWAVMPPDVREVAQVTCVRAWQGRQSGESDQAGGEGIGDPITRRYLSERDRRTLERYAWHPVYII